MFPRAVNFHLLRACDARCRYCFAFRVSRDRLLTRHAIAVVHALREAGAEKLNFVGGEPTLHPDLPALIRAAKAVGFTTSVVSNGARLAPLLDSREGALLDWVGLSIDSATDEGNAAVGRGGPGYVRRVLSLVLRARANGSRVKLNTVVTRVNVADDMRAVVRAVRPDRWKVFQVLRVSGQNDRQVEPLLVSADEYSRFVARHAELQLEGIPVVAETGESMIDSYAMVDPLGRFFGNTGGVHRVGESILRAGAVRAFRSAGFDEARLAARGGDYDWTVPHRGEEMRVSAHLSRRRKSRPI